MDRQIVYAGAIPLETDLLNTNRNTLTAIGALAQDLFGTNTLFSGLGCVPATPAAMSVVINPGRVYSLQFRDPIAYSSLAADTTNQIVKQGILLAAQTFAIAAPATAGFSQNYLISASFLEQDILPVVLPYYNASNPAQAFSGPPVGGVSSGASQNTTRQDTVSLVLTPGVAAATGTQATPATPVGTTPLWVVTVANGQTTITASSINAVVGAPLMPSSLLGAAQSSTMRTANDTGVANAYVAVFQPAITVPVPGAPMWVLIKNTNTGPATFNGAGTVSPLVGASHQPLQGNELVAGGWALIDWNFALTSWVLLFCSGASEQIAAGSKPLHAIQLQQMSAVTGGARNLQASITAAGTSLTITADEIGVKSALAGASSLLASVSLTVATTATGIGGVVGSALVASKWAGVYAAWGPSVSPGAFITGGSALFPEVYAGTLPAGYTQSALISVWPLTAASIFAPAVQKERSIDIIAISVINAGTIIPTPTILSIATAAPLNAKSISGQMSMSSTTASVMTLSLYSSIAGTGQQIIATSVSANNALGAIFEKLKLAVAQSTYITSQNSSGTPTFSVIIGGYDF